MLALTVKSTMNLAAVAFATAAIFLPCPAAASDTPSPTKPNFLFIFTDDQRWDAMGVVQREQGDKARFPWLKTPNLDRIAAEGMRFRNAFVVSPLCAPSRAAFLTGRYNHSNGVANNSTPFPVDSTSFASLLTSAGYQTAYIGKWHMGSQSGQRPGFSYSASFVGQGRYIDCPIEVNGKVVESKGWVDDVTTSYTLDYLRAHKDKPFAITLGFKTSHGPNQPPDRAKNRFDGETARPVPNLETTAIYRQDAAVEKSPAPKGKRARRAARHDAAPTDAKTSAPTNLNYFRTISAIDDNVGKILRELDDLKLSTGTVVIFSSDNGYYFGEHHLSDKRSLYEESLRIPMLVRYPGVIAPGKTSDDMVLNIDLAPTLLDLAGIPVPDSMQGQSWVSLWKTHDKLFKRDSFLGEYFFEKRFPTTPTTLCVRTADAKLVEYPGHPEWTELFNLRDDPYEMTNLYNKPEHADLQNRMTAELEKQKKNTGFQIPKYADKDSGED